MAVTTTTQRTRAGDRTDVRDLVAFVALTYALSWGWSFALVALGLVVRQGTGWPTHYPALLGPALAAVAVTAWRRGRGGVHDLLGRLLRWRVPLRWWLVALSPLGFLAIALLIGAAAGEDLPSWDDVGQFSGTPAIGALGVTALILAVNGVGEETGWRGFALPTLQRRLRPLPATLVLAVIWFAWHLPYFWLLASYRGFAPPMLLVMFLSLACGAVVLTWLYNRSGGSLLLVVVWHGLYNVATGTAAGTGTVQAVVTGLVMVTGLTLAARELRIVGHPGACVLGPAPAVDTPTQEG